MNAKEELEQELEGATIIAASVRLYGDSFVLKPDHSEEELRLFWRWMDQEYDAGYGGQNLFGTIWLSESEGWLERGEYDGSEWWETLRRPELP